MEMYEACNLVAQFLFLFHFWYGLCKQPTVKFPSNLRCDLLQPGKKSRGLQQQRWWYQAQWMTGPTAERHIDPSNERSPECFLPRCENSRCPWWIHACIREQFWKIEVNVKSVYIIHYHLKVFVFLYIFSSKYLYSPRLHHGDHKYTKTSNIY